MLKRFSQVVLFGVGSILLVSAGYAQPYSEVYVFGESFVDVGNVKAAFASFGFDFPPSPPYAEGRHCNGPVFPEVIADNLELGPLEASVVGGSNYAYGAARSVVDVLFLGFIPIPSVRTQVESYLVDVGGTADPEALYILQDGGNDSAFAVEVFFGTGDWDAAAAVIEESALGMANSVRMLADAGAVNFVIPGAPYFSESAWLCGLAIADSLGGYYNTLLETELAGLDGELRILYFDLFGFETAVAEHFITGCTYCVSMFDPTVPECSNPNRFNELGRSTCLSPGPTVNWRRHYRGHAQRQGSPAHCGGCSQLGELQCAAS
jgi:phospholipase/lecithinase/hemolysin